jgi:hypothetical protein
MYTRAVQNYGIVALRAPPSTFAIVTSSIRIRPMQPHITPLLYAAKRKKKKKNQLQVVFRLHFGDLKYF